MATNLFASIPNSLPDELFEILFKSSQVRIERIVSTGQNSSPGFWYDQTEAEWVVVFRGAATLLIESQPLPVSLLPGDYLFLPAHCRHRVESTSQTEPTVWLAVFINDADPQTVC